MSPSPDSSTPDSVRDGAVEWHVRLSSDAATDADWLAFERWLAADPAHRRAYETVETFWTQLDGAMATDGVVPLQRRRKPAFGRVKVWIGALAASLLLVVAVGLGFRGGAQVQSYETARGQRQLVALADGTRVTLNGGSRITVKLERRERRVFMADAEAVFDVAKDPSRPFVIQAGDRQVRVVGTEFDVLRRSGQVQVTVRRGLVEVRPVKSAGPLIARLHPGQTLSHREGAAGDEVQPADADAAFAWTQGRLIFRNARLADAAIVLNRYLETPIVVAPDAQDLRVTAALTLGPDAAMLKTLCDFLPVRAERQDKTVRLSRKQATR